MTGPTTSASGSPRRLTFTLLAESLRLIKVTPAWAEVERAIAELREAQASGRNLAELEEQVSQVRAFENLLLQSSALIGEAIACGALAGSLKADASREEQIIAGMEAIARALNFEALDERRTTVILKELTPQLARRLYSASELAWNPVPQIGDGVGLNEWKLAISEALQRVASAGAPDVTRTAISVQVWENLYAYFTGAAGADASRDLASEVICGAAGARPIALFGYDLGAVSIGAWAIALRDALRVLGPSDDAYCPPWVAPAALRALGFMLDAQRAVQVLAALDRRARAFSPHAALLAGPLAQEQGSGARSRPTHANARVLLIRPERSLFDPWLPSRRMAVLPVFVESLRGLAANQSVLFETVGFTHVLIEEFGTVLPPDKGVESFFSALSSTRHGPRVPVSFVYATEPRNVPPGPCIIAPASPQDVLAQLSAPPSPPPVLG